MKGPWFPVMYQDVSTVCFIFVPDRNGNFLLYVIEINLEEGATAVNDEWAWDNRSSQEGYINERVCHKRHSVHTQAIERTSIDFEATIKRNRNELKGRRRNRKVYLNQVHMVKYALSKSIWQSIDYFLIESLSKISTCYRMIEVVVTIFPSFNLWCVERDSLIFLLVLG